MKNLPGFTYLEMIIYLGIVTLMMTALIPFAWNAIEGGAKSATQQEVYSQANYISEKIKHEIRNADDINSVSASQIVLATTVPATNPTTIRLNSSNITIQQGAGSPIILNSQNVHVNYLTFADYSSADGNAKNIQYTFTVLANYPGAGNRQEYNASSTIEDSAELLSNNSIVPTLPPTPTPTAGLTPTATPKFTPTPTITPRPTATPTPTPDPIIAQDTFQRANQSGLGTASDGQVWGADAQNSSFFSMNGNTGQIKNTDVNTYNAIIGPTATNSEVLFTGYGTGGSWIDNNIGAILHWQDANNWYKAYIGNRTGSGTLQIVLEKRYQGTYYDLAAVNFNPTLGTNYSLRFRVFNNAFYVRAWQTSAAEPATWTINNITDTTGTTIWASGNVGIRAKANTGSSGFIVHYTSFLAIRL